MIERILERARRSDFDFREHACPDDPARAEFDDQVERYRLQEAITAVLQPETVALLGCGYGYGAHAVSRARPEARLRGFDGGDLGVSEALAWARHINGTQRARFEPGGPERLAELEEGVFDLVVVPARARGDDTWCEVEAAARFARWVVVERYFDPRCKGGFLAVNEFLHRFAADIDEVHLLPGRHAHLIFAPSPRLHRAPTEESFHADRRSSQELQAVYTEEYFLTDCGGYQSYRRHGGRILDDARLQAVATIASQRPRGRVLDLGCGRGELSYYLARRGYAVTALDYSADAIALAKRCFAGETELLERVEFVCGDALRAPLEGPYDLVVASDVIEHLMPDENAALYGRLAGLLGHDGLLVIHTYPNRWYYDREYPRRRTRVEGLGGYLSPQPRSRYELVVHPNEQDPDGVESQLRASFEHVLVWVGDPVHAGASLVEQWPPDRRDTAPDIFAVASPAPIDEAALAERLQTVPLALAAHASVHLDGLSLPEATAAGSSFSVEVSLRNEGEHMLTSSGTHPVHLSYRWLAAHGECVEPEGERSKLVPPLPPGATESYRVAVRAPARTGDLTLRLTLVQEGVAWFDQQPGPSSHEAAVSVVSSGEPRADTALPPRAGALRISKSPSSIRSVAARLRAP